MTLTRKQKIAAIPLHERFLLDEDTASIVCGVSRPVLRKWAHEGLLRPVKLPGGVNRNLYRKDDVKAFVAGLPED